MTTAFSPDGQILAVSHFARVVRLIEASTGQELAQLAAPHPVEIGWRCFSPDGGQLAAVSGRHVIQVWDLRLIRG